MSTLTGSSLNLTLGDQSLAAYPTGNSYITYNTLTAQAYTQSSTDREFLANFGLFSNLGASAQPDSGHQDKVAVYSGIEALPGSGNVWAINTVTVLDGNVGNFSAHGIEIDMTNFNMDYGGGRWQRARGSCCLWSSNFRCRAFWDCGYWNNWSNRE